MMTMLQNTAAATNAAIAQAELSSDTDASNWRAFATDILAALAVPRPVSWAFALRANPKPETATEAANNTAGAAPKPKDQPQPKAQDFVEPESIDVLLDMVELEATMGNMVVAEDPPVLSNWRPRVPSPGPQTMLVLRDLPDQHRKQILALVRALARKAAREDHAAERGGDDS